MPLLHRRDPGACPVCGAAHTSCTPSGKSIEVPQLPARDGTPGGRVTVIVAGRPLTPTEFTTKTYDRKVHGPPRKRRPR